MGFWRNLYYYAGWEYKPTETTEKIKRNRHEVMTQIRSYGNNIKDIVLGEEGEVRENTPTLDIGVLENEDDFIIDSITDYTRLFEGVDVQHPRMSLRETSFLPLPSKKRRKRKRNKISF